MKILITHELFPPDVSGGGERLVLRLAKNLVEQGHSVEVVTSGNPEIKSYKGIKTVRIPANRYLMNILSLPTILSHAADADIIQTSSGNMCFPSYIAATILNKPVCCWVHHIFGKYWRDIRGPIVGRLFEFFERFILTLNYDSWVFQNKSSKRIGTDIGIPSRKISMISPGVDYNVFGKGSTKRKGYVLFIGNFSMDEPTIKTKGVKYLLEAAEMLPDIEFKIVGNFKERLKHPKNVSIIGVMSHRKLKNFYKQAGVLVCSSLNEGFGLSLLEAMASGCAIVSTIDIGQIGKRINPKDSKGLAKAIESYINNPSKARKEGAKNRKLARKYTWNRFYSGFRQLYRNLNKYRNK
jgi:glycosyltransferase involved in cell wall biosynthesis